MEYLITSKSYQRTRTPCHLRYIHRPYMAPTIFGFSHFETSKFRVFDAIKFTYSVYGFSSISEVSIETECMDVYLVPMMLT